MIGASLNQTTVPPGNVVRLHQVRATPAVVRTATGPLIAHLGFGSDDPTEAETVFAEASAQYRDSTRANFVRHNVKLSELFAPCLVEFETLSSVVIWTTRHDALAGGREIIARFRAFDTPSQC
jgi:hypothetical protein